MKLSTSSHTLVVSCIQKALDKYVSGNAQVITDIHMQADMESGQLVISDDDDAVLAEQQIPEWESANPENFYTDVEIALKRALNQLREEGALENVKILKPYSFVLEDSTKETVAELLMMDDEETLFLNDELLKGLDEELNTFLKDLLEK
jgi:hypothetical protein